MLVGAIHPLPKGRGLLASAWIKNMDDMMQYYIGKCPECGEINAGTLALLSCSAFVKGMIDSGLIVTKIESKSVALKTCEHCGKRQKRQKGHTECVG